MPVPAVPLRASSLSSLFLGWYLWTEPLRIIRGYGRYALAFGALFSFVFLVKTLLSPWKSITEAYPSQGLNLSAIAQTFALNAVSRVIGCIIRLAVMGVGIVTQALLLLAMLIYLLLWAAFPLIILLSIAVLFGIV